jgi:dTDP-4-amino-4,6-dideoxygalactose transaminase
MYIPFNKPFLTGKETIYIEQAVATGKISGDGSFTKKCHTFFEETFGFRKALLTTSCTDALEMAAILLNLQEGDEVIVPSYTFVSTANAFVLRGAKLIFADSRADHPGMDEARIEALITPKTKAIVVVHYAGVACDMDIIMDIAERHHLFVVEDAAQAIDSYYKDRPLGSIGHLGAFSFHETKNIISGEGGMLVMNDPQFIERAEIIREKGTNRSKFFRGEVDKYNWVDIGSSFLPSDIIAAFLFAQLENLGTIQAKRKLLWDTYWKALQPVRDYVSLPQIPEFATNNAHMFYLVCKSIDERDALIQHLKRDGIMAVFHYQSLHSSNFYADKHDGRDLEMVEFYTSNLLRLPMFFELSPNDIQNKIAPSLLSFYKRT